MELYELGRASYLLHVKSLLEEIMIRQHLPKRAYYSDYSTTVMYAWCHGSVHALCPECHGNNLHASTFIPHYSIKLIFNNSHIQ